MHPISVYLYLKLLIIIIKFTNKFTKEITENAHNNKTECIPQSCPTKIANLSNMWTITITRADGWGRIFEQSKWSPDALISAGAAASTGRSIKSGLSKGEKKINKGFSVCIYVHEAVCLPALTTWVTCEWVWVPIYLLRFAVLMFVLVLVLVLVLFLRTKEFLSGSSSTSPVRAPSSQHVASYHTHISARAYRRLGTHSRREVRLKLLQQCSNVLKLLMCCFY